MLNLTSAHVHILISYSLLMIDRGVSVNYISILAHIILYSYMSSAPHSTESRLKKILCVFTQFLCHYFDVTVNLEAEYRWFEFSFPSSRLVALLFTHCCSWRDWLMTYPGTCVQWNANNLVQVLNLVHWLSWLGLQNTPITFLQRGKILPTSVLDITLNNLMVRFQ